MLLLLPLAAAIYGTVFITPEDTAAAARWMLLSSSSSSSSYQSQSVAAVIRYFALNKKKKKQKKKPPKELEPLNNNNDDDEDEDDNVRVVPLPLHCCSSSTQEGTALLREREREWGKKGGNHPQNKRVWTYKRDSRFFPPFPFPIVIAFPPKKGDFSLVF